MPPPETRQYSMSDGDVIQRADLLETSITRDTADFTDRGVDADRLALMTDARDAFSDHPTDALLLGQVNAKTILKNTARDTLLVSLRKLRGMAGTKYGLARGLYNSFGFRDMDTKSDNDLVRVAKGAIAAGTTLLTDLATEGLTDTKLTAMTTLNTDFDTAVDEHRKAVQTRDISTQTRVRLGNALFAQVMELANIGKSIYLDSDASKYNDYVIHDSPSHGETPQTYIGSIAAGETKTLAEISYNADEFVKMENTGEAILIFSINTIAGLPEGSPQTVAPADTKTLTMAELNANADANILQVHNTDGAQPGAYIVTVGL